MVNLAKEEFPNKDVGLFVADGFKLPLRENTKFDIIHIDGVLHHLIGKTRKESFTKVEKILNILGKALSNNGVLIVGEFNFVSYLFPSFTSFFVFYCLKLINFFNLDISKFSDEVKPGPISRPKMIIKKLSYLFTSLHKWFHSNGVRNMTLLFQKKETFPHQIFVHFFS